MDRENELELILTKLENEVAADVAKRIRNHTSGKSPKTSHSQAITALTARENRMVQEAYEDGILEGFKRSGEGFNGEYPFGDQGSSDNEIREAIDLPPKEPRQ